MRSALIPAILFALFSLFNVAPATAQQITCMGTNHGIPYGCRPNFRSHHRHPRFVDTVMRRNVQVLFGEDRYLRRTRHTTIVRGGCGPTCGTVPCPEQQGVAPAWKQGTPPGNGQVTRVSEFDQDGQAYCDKYVNAVYGIRTEFRYWKGAGADRKAHCE
jgi:hypothetical protein